METIYKGYKYPGAQQAITRWCESRLAAWGVPHQRCWWTTTAGHTHVLQAGAPEAPAVVWLPGEGMNAATHLRYVEPLIGRYRLIVPDLPGEPGLSSGRRVESARVRQLGVWLQEVLDQVGRPATVVGHSLGAAAALTADSRWMSSRLLIAPYGLARRCVSPSTIASAVRWNASPSAAASADLLKRLGPGAQDADLREWLTLAGRNTRAIWPPPPLAREDITPGPEGSVTVFGSSSDPLVPIGSLQRRCRELLGTEVRPFTGAHLPDDEGWRSIRAALIAVLAARDPHAAAPGAPTPDV